MFNSVRTRLIAVMILLAAGSLLIVGSLLIYQTFNAQQDDAHSLQTETSLRIANEVRTSIEREGENLSLVNQMRRLVGQPLDEQRAVLTEALTWFTFAELTLMDAQGQEVIRISRTEVVPDERLVSRADTDEFKVPSSQGVTYYGPAFFDEQTGEPFMFVSIPLVNTRTGAVDNVLVAQVRLKGIWDLLVRQEYTAGQDIFVVAAIGGVQRIIAHRNPSVVLGGSTFDADVDATVATGLSGDEVVLGVTPFEIGTQEFRAVSELTTSEAYKAAYQALYTMIFSMAIIIVGTGVIGYFIMRQITEPIITLAHAAERIGAGDLSVQVEAGGKTEIGTLSRAFNTMVEQVRGSVETLEARVQARTRDLQIATQVSEEVATILDPDRLLPRVVDLTCDSFALYHTHIYLFDASRENLVLAAGAGEAGRVMKQRGHQISAALPQSLVARAARTDEPVIVDDVTATPDFLSNPLLPDTRSEAAFPLSVGGRVLGVLDVQSEQLARFDTDMQTVLSTLAGQIAVAIDNARLFSETERTSRHEQALSQIMQEIQGARSVEEVLQAAARGLGQALRVPHTTIELQLKAAATEDGSEPDQSEMLAADFETAPDR